MQGLQRLEYATKLIIINFYFINIFLKKFNKEPNILYIINYLKDIIIKVDILEYQGLEY